MHNQLRLIQKIALDDGHYAPEAFLFVSEAIAHTVDWIRKGEIQPQDVGSNRGESDEFHVSGHELLKGLRRLAHERWGSMARTVLATWGVHRTEDFGRIVFLMVENEEMQWRKRDCDSEADFADGFDFAEAFDSLD